MSEGEEKEKAKTNDQIFGELTESSMAKDLEGDIKDKMKISTHIRQSYTSENMCASTTDFIYLLIFFYIYDFI